MTTPPTRRELAALAAVADGLTSEQAATRLGITRTAVDLRTSRAARKLGARNREYAITAARRHGLITPGPDGHVVRLRDIGPLTDSQWRALREIARGRTTDAAARRLHLSANTIKTHLKAAYSVLGASSAAHAVAACMSCGWITPADLGLPLASHSITRPRDRRPAHENTRRAV